MSLLGTGKGAHIQVIAISSSWIFPCFEYLRKYLNSNLRRKKLLCAQKACVFLSIMTGTYFFYDFCLFGRSLSLLSLPHKICFVSNHQMTSSQYFSTINMGACEYIDKARASDHHKWSNESETISVNATPTVESSTYVYGVRLPIINKISTS